MTHDLHVVLRPRRLRTFVSAELGAKDHLHGRGAL